MKKKLVTIVASACLVLALVALSIVSCGEVEPGPTPEPTGLQRGGILKIGRQMGVVVTLGYPPTCRKAPLAVPCIETLLSVDETGAPAPWLATGWEIAPDLKSITFTLRKGVKFHDGTDFNAAAVKWNMESYMAAGRVELKQVESIDVLDDYTIRLNLSEFSNLLISQLASSLGGWIISPTAYETHGQEWCEGHPVGTGPFKFVSWEVDVSVKYERFDDYWQEGKPYLDGLEFYIIKDPLVLSAAFQRGEVHMIYEVPAKEAVELDTVGKYNMAMSPSDGGEINGLAPDSANPGSILADIRVRRAMDYAIDRETICQKIGYGYIFSVNQRAKPGGWAYNPNVVGYPYNPDKARELLAEAGYPDGLKTNLYVLNEPQIDVDAMTAVQGYLREVGIDAVVDLMDRGRHFNLAVKGGWQDGLVTTQMGIGMDELIAFERWDSPGSVLFISYERPAEYQELIAQAVATPDFDTKKALVWQIQELTIDKYCMVTPFYIKPSMYISYPEVHDDGLGTGAPGWTPEDCWLSK